MGESVVIFFKTNSNHLSNVRTIQSIYDQDYESIQLIVCNDCTHGFEAERLMYNFQPKRRENIKRVVFHENVKPLGEYHSQRQFWDRINDAYYMVIHSGERFTSASALSRCVAKMEEDMSLSAVVSQAEVWSNDMKKKLDTLQVTESSRDGMRFGYDDLQDLNMDKIRDCMVLYRFADLKGSAFAQHGENGSICRHAIPQMLQEEKDILVCASALCRYSEQSITDTVRESSQFFGNETLSRIDELIQKPDELVQNSDKPMQEPDEHKQPELFADTGVREKTPKRSSGRIGFLFKYSRFVKIKFYMITSLLVTVAAALLLNIDHASVKGFGYLLAAAAIAAFVWTAGMLGVNLYFKKYPQRMVSENE